MSFELLFTNQASDDLDYLEKNKKALGYLSINPRHPSLNTHKYTSLIGPNKEEIFETYAENKKPAAYRIFWYYGPKKNQITILAITPHP